jgi:hypothetical protein
LKTSKNLQTSPISVKLPPGTAQNLSQTRWRLLSTFMQAKFPSHETYWQKGRQKRLKSILGTRKYLFYAIKM